MPVPGSGAKSKEARKKLKIKDLTASNLFIVITLFIEIAKTEKENFLEEKIKNLPQQTRRKF